MDDGAELAGALVAVSAGAEVAGAADVGVCGRSAAAAGQEGGQSERGQANAEMLLHLLLLDSSQPNSEAGATRYDAMESGMVHGGTDMFVSGCPGAH